MARSSQTKQEIIYPGVRPQNSHTQGLATGSSPLFVGSNYQLQDYRPSTPRHSYVLPNGEFNLHVTDISVEQMVTSSTGGTVHVYETAKTDALPGFDQFMPATARQTGFILDIDLDAFVSNGTNDPGMKNVIPISYGRESSNHNMTSEGDLKSGLSASEMYMIRKRVDAFFKRLEEAKRNGVLPRVITIADSTQLMRAIRGENEDFMGGNYTPACLAFILNFMVRERLKNLYPEVSLQN